MSGFTSVGQEQESEATKAQGHLNWTAKDGKKVA